MKIGLVGCGSICWIYMDNLRRSGEVEVAACADLNDAKAQDCARHYGFNRVLSTDDLINDPDVDLVLNLTFPKAHFDVSLRALQADKHVYVEKPLALTVEEGRTLIETARERGLQIGCAPDTVLGAGIQTCRELIDSGAIGRPVGGHGFMLCPGHESWHPDPEFYYQTGGGPLFDMGPYYLSAFVTLLGPVSRVNGMCSTLRSERTITSQPKHGQTIPVETPTHILSQLEFENGAMASLTTSFDVPRSTLPPMEIYGTEGSLLVPDPNMFGGPVKLFEAKTGEWRDIEISRPHLENSRGLGVLDLVRSHRDGCSPRASGEVGFHVLEIMESALRSASSGARVAIQSRPSQPDPMGLGNLFAR